MTKREAEQGLMFLGGQYEAREFIREYFYEAIDHKERLGEDLGVDPPLDSEKFAMGMVRESVAQMTNELDIIAEAREFGVELDIDKKLIGNIRKELDQTPTLDMGKELDIVME